MVRKAIIITLLIISFKTVIKAQELLSPTFTNVGASYSTSRMKFMGSIGETFVGLKNINKHIIIEGFYAFNMYKLDSISYQLAECRVFPNPAKGSFVVYNENNNFNVKLEIYNIAGINIKSSIISANTIISVNDLQTGIYLIKITETVGHNKKYLLQKQIIMN